MRVSSETLFRSATGAMQGHNGTLVQLQEQIGSGRRFHHAHEAPAAATSVMEWEAAQARIAAQAGAADRVQHRLGMTETALDDAQVMIDRVREQLLSGRSDTRSDSDRILLADEVAGLARDWLQLANRDNGSGEALFAGTGLGAAFDANGGYLGSTVARQVEVADGQQLPDGLTGDRVFGDAGGQDSFAWLAAAEAALRDTDPGTRHAALDAALVGIDAVAENLSRARTDTGNRLNALDRAATWREGADAQLSLALSRLRDTDLIETATQLAQTSAQQSAAQTAYLQISSLSLFDRLR